MSLMTPFAALRDSVGQLGDDKSRAMVGPGAEVVGPGAVVGAMVQLASGQLGAGAMLKVHASIEHKPATTAHIHLRERIAVRDDATGSEIGSADEVNETLDRDRWMIQQLGRGASDAVEIVRRDHRSRSDGAVDEKNRKPRILDDRLPRRRQPALRVDRIGTRVAVDRSEVPLAANQRVPRREVLRERDDALVDLIGRDIHSHFGEEIRALDETPARSMPPATQPTQDRLVELTQSPTSIGNLGANEHPAITTGALPPGAAGRAPWTRPLLSRQRRSCIGGSIPLVCAAPFAWWEASAGASRRCCDGRI